MSTQTSVTSQAVHSEPRAGLKQWFGLAALVLPVLLIAIDMTVLGFAVPHLSADLDPTGEQLLWIVDIYGFMIAGFLITMGSLGDRFGRRRTLLIGSAAFGVASALAAFSPTPEMLIAARALLGVAGATLMPSTLSLIRSLFPDPRQRTVAVAVWASAFSAGAAFGPVLGGFLLEHFFWGSVFLINLPVMALILLSVPFLIAESKDPHPGRIDVLSVAMSLAGMLLAIYGLKKLITLDADAVAGAALALGMLTLVLFVRRQLKLTHPLIDLSLFSVRRFRAGVIVNFMLVFVLVGTLFFLTQLLQTVYEMPPLRASLILLPGLAISVVASFIIIPIARRTSLRSSLLLGLLFVACGFGVLALITPADGVILVLIGFSLLCMGTGLSETLTNDAILTAAPPHRAGAASAISETAYELGGALGVALLGSTLSLTYRSQLTAADFGDSEIPASAVDSASETISAASVTAGELESGAGATLWEAAREAFTTSVQLTSSAAVALTLAVAGAVWLLLRKDSRTPAAAPAAR